MENFELLDFYHEFNNNIHMYENTKENHASINNSSTQESNGITSNINNFNAYNADTMSTSQLIDSVVRLPNSINVNFEDTAVIEPSFISTSTETMMITTPTESTMITTPTESTIVTTSTEPLMVTTSVGPLIISTYTGPLMANSTRLSTIATTSAENVPISTFSVSDETPPMSKPNVINESSKNLQSTVEIEQLSSSMIISNEFNVALGEFGTTEAVLPSINCTQSVLPSINCTQTDSVLPSIGVTSMNHSNFNESIIDNKSKDSSDSSVLSTDYYEKDHESSPPSPYVPNSSNLTTDLPQYKPTVISDTKLKLSDLNTVDIDQMHKLSRYNPLFDSALIEIDETLIKQKNVNQSKKNKLNKRNRNEKVKKKINDDNDTVLSNKTKICKQNQSSLSTSLLSVDDKHTDTAKNVIVVDSMSEQYEKNKKQEESNVKQKLIQDKIDNASDCDNSPSFEKFQLPTKANKRKAKISNIEYQKTMNSFRRELKTSSDFQARDDYYQLMNEKIRIFVQMNENQSKKHIGEMKIISTIFEIKKKIAIAEQLHVAESILLYYNNHVLRDELCLYHYGVTPALKYVTLLFGIRKTNGRAVAKTATKARFDDFSLKLSSTTIDFDYVPEENHVKSISTMIAEAKLDESLFMLRNACKPICYKPHEKITYPHVRFDSEIAFNESKIEDGEIVYSSRLHLKSISEMHNDPEFDVKQSPLGSFLKILSLGDPSLSIINLPMVNFPFQKFPYHLLYGVVPSYAYPLAQTYIDDKHYRLQQMNKSGDIQFEEGEIELKTFLLYTLIVTDLINHNEDNIKSWNKPAQYDYLMCLINTIPDQKFKHELLSLMNYGRIKRKIIPISIYNVIKQSRISYMLYDNCEMPILWDGFMLSLGLQRETSAKTMNMVDDLYESWRLIYPRMVKSDLNENSCLMTKLRPIFDKIIIKPNAELVFKIFKICLKIDEHQLKENYSTDAETLINQFVDTFNIFLDLMTMQYAKFLFKTKFYKQHYKSVPIDGFYGYHFVDANGLKLVENSEFSFTKEIENFLIEIIGPNLMYELFALSKWTDNLTFLAEVSRYCRTSLIAAIREALCYIIGNTTIDYDNVGFLDKNDFQKVQTLTHILHLHNEKLHRDCGFFNPHSKLFMSFDDDPNLDKTYDPNLDEDIVDIDDFIDNKEICRIDSDYTSSDDSSSSDSSDDSNDDDLDDDDDDDDSSSCSVPIPTTKMMIMVMQ